MNKIFDSRRLLGFDDRWFMLLGIPIVALMINAILFGHLAYNEPELLFSNCIFVAGLYTTLFWLIFRSLHQFILSKYPGYSNTKKRYSVLIPSLIVCFAIVKFTLHLLVKPLIDKYFSEMPQPAGTTETIASFLFLILIITIYEGAYLFVQLKKTKLEKEQLIKENISSQLEGLKNQVNPHFLFNSLNTLASIIPEDPYRGVRFVTKLAKVYRYILDINDAKLIPLQEELNFINSYTYLINERFGENITICINVNEEDRIKMIIPLSLQITFENAIKHNVISKAKPLKIDVFVEDNNLIVKNNLQKKNTVGTSTKNGLQNIKNRYQFFTDKEVGVQSTINDFTVSLPILSTSM